MDRVLFTFFNKLFVLKKNFFVIDECEETGGGAFSNLFVIVHSTYIPRIVLYGRLHPLGNT